MELSTTSSTVKLRGADDPQRKQGGYCIPTVLILCAGIAQSVVGRANDRVGPPHSLPTAAWEAVPRAGSAPSWSTSWPTSWPTVPRVSSKLSPRLSRKLESAFDLAVAHIEENPECQRLFSDLARGPRETLAQALYNPAPGRFEQQVCRRGVSAFTRVGSATTYLCRSFARLAPPRAAAAVIHEALHQAGLPEAPGYPGAPLSNEINEWVAARCQL